MTDTSYAQIPAGWYPDPRGSKQRRWWDGSSWTHALEALPEATVAAPAYANLPGPKLNRVPSPSAPTVARAIDAEPTEHFPTRRQLRDAAAVLETQKQFSETDKSGDAAQSGNAENYSMGPAVSATQKPHASFSIEQFRNVAEQTPTEQLTKEASELTKSPAISTASSAPVSSASVTGSPVSAVPQTHTFNAPSAATTPAATTPAAEPEVAATTTSKPFDASEFTNPVIPVNPSAQAAKALAAATAAARSSAQNTDSAAFVPVMRTGATPSPRSSLSQSGLSQSGLSQSGLSQSNSPQNSSPQNSSLRNDPQYQPFGMTPRITTGVVEQPTSVNTGSVWVLTIMPLLFLGAAFALIRFAPEFYTQFIQGGLAFVVVMASFALAIRDRQQLTVRSHRSTASPAWIFLTPLAYLVARAVHTRRQVGRGWAPAIVFVIVSLAAAAGVYFSPLPITAFFAALA